MIEIQKINFPADCHIVHHEFYNYDPQQAYREDDSLKYLHEDLLQCTFSEDEITIDLGWYGEPTTNKGEFKIQIIQNENWEIPLNVIHSKSVEEIKSFLVKIVEYYTSKEEGIEQFEE